VNKCLILGSQGTEKLLGSGKGNLSGWLWHPTSALTHPVTGVVTSDLLACVFSSEKWSDLSGQVNGILVIDQEPRTCIKQSPVRY
jgi:hypothetical protein